MKANLQVRRRKTSTPRRSKKDLIESKTKARFKSILVPIDFSETSLRALDYALSFAAKFGSRIHLIHALEFPAVFNNPSQPSYASWNKGAKKAATTRLDELVNEKIDELISANSEVRLGRAYQVICKAAEEHKADLIIIGTHGFTGLKHVLLGSTAERVIRHAPCSVLAVQRQPGRDVKSVVEPKTILIPTDFSEPAEHALQFAVALGRQFQAELHLVYVVPVHYATGDYDLMDFTILAAEEKETGQKKLGKMTWKLAAQGIPARTEIRHGRPAVEINQAAAELDCDLVVISTRGLTGWKHALLGSTTEEVVRHSLCPVLVVRKK